MAGKITDYPTTTALIDEDLFDISKYDGVSAYATNAITWEDILKEIQIDLTFNNLYNNNGTLAGNRIVSMGVNDLTFGSTGDANLLKFETTNDRIGIGTAAPTEKLEVVGNAKINGNVGIDGSVGVNVASPTKIMQLNSTNAADEISLMSSGTILSRLAFSTTFGGYIQLQNSTGVITEVLIGFGTVDYINTTSNFALGNGTASKKLEVHSALSSNSIDLIYNGDINARMGYNSTVGGYFQLKNNDATSTRLLIGFGSDDYINTGQNLGIGLDTGITEKVHISGNIRVDGYENLTPITAPSSPANGFVIYVDSSDGDLKAKSSTGVTTTIALN